MRQRLLFPSLLVLAGQTAFGLVACSSDDVFHSEQPPPTAPPTGEPPDAGPAFADAIASSVTVYLGQVVTLDASESQGTGAITYAWTVKDVPEGSSITSASLTDATGEGAFSPGT